MRNQRLRTAQNKGGHQRPNPNDFISQMADYVLVMILSLIPIKDVVATSSRSPRWRFSGSYIGNVYMEDVNAIPQLTNVKKLILVVRAHEDDSLLEFTSIAKACPSLETFVIALLWFSLARRRRKIGHVAGHPHEHLKLVEIVGYYGRKSDLELVVYVIENSVSLRKVMIDPICHAIGENLSKKKLERLQEAARSSAKRQITPILPRRVELAIF